MSAVSIFRVTYLRNSNKEEKFFYSREEAKEFLLDMYTEDFLASWQNKNLPMKQRIYTFRSKLPEYQIRCDDVDDHITEGTI
jgi:hypothetical protein